MTSEEKVKHEFPLACISGYGSQQRLGITMVVLSGPGGLELARVHQRRRSWAWAEAWRNIQTWREGAIERVGKEGEHDG